MPSLRAISLKQLGTLTLPVLRSSRLLSAVKPQCISSTRTFFKFLQVDPSQELEKERQARAADRKAMDAKLKQVEENTQAIQARLAQIEAAIASCAQGDDASKSNAAEIQAELAKHTQTQQGLQTEIGALSKGLTSLQMTVNENAADLSALKEKASAPAPAAEPAADKPKKEKAPKAPKAPKAAPAPSGDDLKPLDASRLDLRVGKIIDCQKHPDADSLYVEQIECGEEKPRTVVSGLVKFVPVEQMQNRMVVILCNLKPAKMRGVLSQAMVMCASTADKVEVLAPPPGAVPGDRVTFEKFAGEPDAQLNPKKKIWEQIAPDLSTNGDLAATYKGDPFIVVGKGPVVAETLKNVPVK